MKHKYLCITVEDLRIERQQCLDEGKDLSPVEAELKELANLDIENDPGLQRRAEELLDKTMELPVRKDYSYEEPSDLEGIRRARPESAWKGDIKLDEEALFDKVLGAWQGRCSGCLLGKPVEGWRSLRMWGYLKDSGRYPLDDYFTSGVSSEIAEKYKIEPGKNFIEGIKCVPEDDDINYTVIGLAVLKKYGQDFTPGNVADFWIHNLPILHTYTAERVAYRNFTQGIVPPMSAAFRNPYREWIGAQIRGDFFGYVNPGDPESAAGFARKDGCISHVKNGIYGEMWAAAMLAAAAVESDVKRIITAGLSEIPARSRLAEAVRQAIGWYKEGVDFESAISRIHERWDETDMHHWCHTISNAQIVTLGLLWGGSDFEKSICRAVQAGFDTDCNGATVGSVLGMMLGAKELPGKWIEPLNDTVETGVAGYEKVKISALAEKGFNLYGDIKK